MNVVYIYISTGRFRLFEDMRYFIDMTYTENGEGIPSNLMKEVTFTQYEPMCIEAVISKPDRPVFLTELLSGASYSEQWLCKLDLNLTADAAICIFSPNELAYPQKSSLQYIGMFGYCP